LAEEVLSAFKQGIDSWTLIPSRGGVHEVEIDGELVHSKRETGEHPSAERIIAAIAERLASEP